MLFKGLAESSGDRQGPQKGTEYRATKHKSPAAQNNDAILYTSVQR